MERLLGISPETLSVVDETLQTTLGMSLNEMVQLVRKGEINPGNTNGDTERAADAS